MQRRLNGLGFDTKVTGKFDASTRAVITRWQAARGYPSSGFLNRFQHKALLTEIVVTDANRLVKRLGRQSRRAAPQQQQRSSAQAAASAAAGMPVRPSSAAWSAACWAARSDADRPIR